MVKYIYSIVFILLSVIGLNGASITNVLDDFEGGIGKWTSSAYLGNITPTEETNIVHKGSKSIKVAYTITAAWGNATLQLQFASQSNISGYDVLIFYMRGEVTNGGRINVAMYDDDNNTLDYNYDQDDYFAWTGGKPNQNYWVKYVIPLKPNFFVDGNTPENNGGKPSGDGIIEFNEIEEIDIYIDDPYGGVSGTYYLDDVMLVKGYQAVEELDRDKSVNNITLKDFETVYKKGAILSFKIDVKEESDVNVMILDFKGNLIYNEKLNDFSGVKDFMWNMKSDGINIESGIYFIRVESVDKKSGKTSAITKRFFVVK